MKMRGLLDKARAQNHNVRFVLCTPFVAKAGKTGLSDNYNRRKEMIAMLGQVVRNVAEAYHATVVPFDSLVEETISQNPGIPASYWIGMAFIPRRPCTTRWQGCGWKGLMGIYGSASECSIFMTDKSPSCLSDLQIMYAAICLYVFQQFAEGGVG